MNTCIAYNGRKKFVKPQYVFLLITIMISLLTNSFANNISITNTKLTAQNTTANIVKIEFSVSWENSFRVSTGPANWDAAWIFVKYRVAVASGGDGLWRHATLNTTGQTIPSGSIIKMTPEGALVYRSVNGNGTFNVNGAGFYWNYGTHVEAGTNDFIEDDDAIEIKVFGIEMVYVPGGVSFNVGGGGGPTAFTSTTISTANAAAIGTGFPTGQTNNNALFPNGYNAFYCMKYEISQQQYVDFLNTLTIQQQGSRTSAPPSSPAGYAALYNWYGNYATGLNYNRNSIDIQVPSTESSPAIYACNLDGDNIYGEENDGQWLACNYLIYADWLAFLAWSGLRPMTELEYEKACRGTLPPVINEYSWGSSAIVKSSEFINPGTAEESPLDITANVYETKNMVNGGPVRVGMFATSVSSRALSGATYYGIMDMTGNIQEFVVHVGTNPKYTGLHGKGQVLEYGKTEILNWPGEAIAPVGSRGISYRGGDYGKVQTVSHRGTFINAVHDNKLPNEGGRGVRTAPL